VRSRADRRRAVFCAAIALAAAMPCILSATGGAGPRASSRPDAAEIARAIETVKKDPNLATTQTIKSLRWRSAETKEAPRRRPFWLEWIAGFFRWVNRSLRLLAWCVVAVLAVLMTGYLARLAGARAGKRHLGASLIPTHVGDLDIRPESLPDDVGSAARALWDRGQHRASLALLYRAMLSRLTHVHLLPIHDSTTEGDCLELSGEHLPGRAGAYVARLVRLWQRAVYGGESVDTNDVHALCREFDAELNTVTGTAATMGVR